MARKMYPPNFRLSLSHRLHSSLFNSLLLFISREKQTLHRAIEKLENDIIELRGKNTFLRNKLVQKRHLYRYHNFYKSIGYTYHARML